MARERAQVLWSRDTWDFTLSEEVRDLERARESKPAGTLPVKTKTED